MGDTTTTNLDPATLAKLRAIHYPVTAFLGTFDHRWLHLERRVSERFRTDETILQWIEDRLPEHMHDSRYPNSCGDVCSDVELEGPMCASCGAGQDDDGDWHGHLWPCATAEALALDLDAPPATAGTSNAAVASTTRTVPTTPPSWTSGNS